MTLKALIFDVDGTLAETEEVHRLAFNAAFAEAGLGWTWDRDTYRELLAVTGGKERMAHYGAAHATAAGLRVPDADAIATLHRRKTAHYTRAVGDGALGLRPGIRELIDAAHASGIALAIATTTSPENVESLLVATLDPDARAAFKVIVAGDMVARKKPQPDAYLATLQQLSLPAEGCLAIEDSLNGLRAAMAAGIATVITPSLYTSHERFEGALACVPDLTALAPDAPGSGEAILRTLERRHAEGRG